MGRRRTACRTCAAIKAVCSKEAPCARCKRLSLQCSLDLRSLYRADVPENVPLGTRTRHTKTSTGCLNCRKRRKKCDEKRPVCGDCSRLKVLCILREGSNGTASSVIEDWVISETPEDSSNELVGNFQASFDWISVIDEEYSTESSVKGASLANSSALEVQPDNRASDNFISREGIVLPSTALGNLAGITPASLQNWTVGERHLLNHFLQSVARSLVLVHDAENPFMNVIVPMAFDNVAVRHALVALSACHLARIYPDFERNLLKHRSHALQCLKAELDTSNNIIWSVASTLLLCLLEICAGDSRRWLLYLHGARALLSAIQKKLVHPPMDFFIDLYDYLCCIAAVTSDNVPKPISTTLGLTKAGLSGIHPLFGIAAPLYTSLAQVNALALGLDDASGSSRNQFRTDARAIELSLQSWSPPEAENEPLEMAEVRAAAFAIQWAVILRLREVAPLSTDTQYIQNRGPIDHIISALSLVRPGSLTEARMLFPVFMAGISSISKAERLTLEFRVNIMKNTIGFGNIASAHQILDEIWRRGNRGETCNWRELMRSKTPGMILF